MPDQIQKYDTDNKPATSAKSRIIEHLRNPLVFLVIGVIVLGLWVFTTNGLFDRHTALIITYVAVIYITIGQFGKYRGQLQNKWYRFWKYFCIAIFTVVFVHLYSLDVKTMAHTIVSAQIGDFIFQPNSLAGAHVIIENVGQAPALHLVHYARLSNYITDDSDSTWIMDVVGRHKNEGESLFQGKRIIASYNFPEIVRAPMPRDSNYYILGAIYYRDESQTDHLTM